MAKVAELEGAKLNYWVAQAEGVKVTIDYANDCCVLDSPYPYPDERGWRYDPIDDWLEAGKIIEREKIHIQPIPLRNPKEWRAYWASNDLLTEWTAYGPTALIAAMRCYVASKFGESVDD